jgi:hypothetical protein
MSKGTKDISRLFRNISDVLSVYNLKEINKVLLSIIYDVTNVEKQALLKKRGKPSIDKQTSLKIDYALQLVCDSYNISRNGLITKSGKRGEIQDAKRTAYCLLYYNVGLSIRFIAYRVFFCFPNSVAIGLKKLKTADTNIRHEKEFLERYQSLSKILYQKTKNLTLEHKQHENIS